MLVIINEIFRSIQGESTYAGSPCTFIRLTGCNLRCRWCDTTYAFHEGKEMKEDEVVERIQAYPLDLIEITGGEPLFQPQTPALCRRLLRLGARVLVETNGSLDINILPPEVIRIIDIKCPSSGEADSMNWRNLHYLHKQDEVKFVIADRSDFDYALTIIDQFELLKRGTVLLAPAFNCLPYAQLAEWILASKKALRLQLQLQKIIWHGDRRGV